VTGAAGEPDLLDAIERRAAEIDGLAAAVVASGSREDAAKLSAMRRFLLIELDSIGLLDGSLPERAGEDPGRPILATYAAAAEQLRAYLAGDERRVQFPDDVPPASVRGAAVGLDWFRLPSPRPNPLERPFRWLAVCERTLLAAGVDENFAGGEVFLRRGDDWWALGWRRDDGVTAALVGARRA
jgi:hypothetical protein